MKCITIIFYHQKVKNDIQLFQVDGMRFKYAQHDIRMPGLFKVEANKDEMVSLCSKTKKMYCASDITGEKIKFSCKGIQKMVMM